MASNFSTTASSPMTTRSICWRNTGNECSWPPPLGSFTTPFMKRPHGASRLKRRLPGACLSEQVENCANVYRELRKRGLRVLIGGDYGFAWTPHGTNARALDHFVKWFGYTPEEALVCGTINGAKAMRMDNEIGRVRDGYLADLIIVRGRPHEEVSCLTTANILVVL